MSSKYYGKGTLAEELLSARGPWNELISFLAEEFEMLPQPRPVAEWLQM
jgi:hypothetical protein